MTAAQLAEIKATLADHEQRIASWHTILDIFLTEMRGKEWQPPKPERHLHLVESS